MAALQFVITTAGQSLLSQVSTIGPVTLTKVAIGSAGYTASASATALTTQIKQITPSGSNVPAPGIIHITAQDNSTDTYTVKEIGLYAGTTLFAIYSQTTAILTKASGNVALFSIDLALTNVPAGSVTIGSATFAYPPATESTQGVAQIATTAQVTAGTDDATIVTPAKLKAGYVKKSGDTMSGALYVSKPNGGGTASISLDSNAGGTGNAAIGVSGAAYFYIGTNDLQTTGLITNGTPRLVVNPNGTIDAKTNQIYDVASLALLADPPSAMYAATKQYVDRGGWQVKSSNYAAANYDHILADTSAGGWTLTLPDPPITGAVILIADYKGTWRANNLTVSRSTKTIEGLSEDLVMNINRRVISLVYDGTTWRVSH